MTTQPEPLISTLEKYFIVVCVMLATTLEVLDTTIVTIALPHMMGSLGANTEQITWVLTSYIVAAAVTMPLTGFLVKKLGQKTLLMGSILGFLATSMLCGFSHNLTQIVLFRTLQGVFGACLVPLSQTILFNTFSERDRGKAMAIWGIGVMVGPVMGPTLGGFITEFTNWRWVFFINAPVCLLASFIAWRVIRETPRCKASIDWLGAGLMILGVSTLQIFLDRGNQEHWFQSNTILFLFATSMVSLVIFVIRGLRIKNNIINLRLFVNGTFAAANGLGFLFMVSIIGVLALIPIMLESLYHYPSNLAGLIMAPRGITSAIAMAFVAGLINRVDPRLLISAGILIAGLGTYCMIGFNLETGQDLLMLSAAIQGFGMGLFFVPVSTLALATLRRQDVAEGSGLFSFTRSIGNSVGISSLTTVLTNETQVNWQRLGGHIQWSNPNFQTWLSQHHFNLYDPATIKILAGTLSRQASMVAFLDTYWASLMGILCMLPFVLLLRRKKPTA
ncbi:MAG: DHA2 family efflux MFS transporter permease subunit [Gammaproteobacteria bacterium]